MEIASAETLTEEVLRNLPPQTVRKLTVNVTSSHFLLLSSVKVDDAMAIKYCFPTASGRKFFDISGICIAIDEKIKARLHYGKIDFK